MEAAAEIFFDPISRERLSVLDQCVDLKVDFVFTNIERKDMDIERCGPNSFGGSRVRYVWG